MKNQYTLIAYKPSSEDYCLGCHMASYSSDLTIETGVAKERLEDLIVHFLIKNTETGNGEAEYEMSVLVNGIYISIPGSVYTPSYLEGAYAYPDLSEDEQVAHDAFVAKSEKELADMWPRIQKRLADDKEAKIRKEARLSRQHRQEERHEKLNQIATLKAELGI